jgi:hypothetical protein
MKKIIGIITAVALFSIMGCSDDNETSPTAQWSWQERIFAPPAPLDWKRLAASADGMKLYAGAISSEMSW